MVKKRATIALRFLKEDEDDLFLTTHLITEELRSKEYRVVNGNSGFADGVVYLCRSIRFGVGSEVREIVQAGMPTLFLRPHLLPIDLKFRELTKCYALTISTFGNDFRDTAEQAARWANTLKHRER
ncbi:MAG TPA: hypothetical protein VGA06_00230 [Candidatus Paceibacterota bacterium]|jgi:hypothetical protein